MLERVMEGSAVVEQESDFFHPKYSTLDVNADDSQVVSGANA